MLSSLIQSYQNAYSGLSKNSWYLSIVMLINRSGTMVIPFMSIYAIQVLHFTIVQSGMIMAFFGIGSFFGAFIGGKLTDKIGFYDIQVGALLVGGILFIILGFQHTFLSLSICTFILSVCNDSFRPANSAAIAHYSDDSNKTRSYSLNRLAVNLGWAFGGGLGGLLASYSYHSLFWVDGCTNIFAAVLLLTLMPRSKIKTAINKVKDVVTATSSAYKDKVYLVFIVLNTLFSVCFFEFFIMQPVFYKIQWHLNESYIGFLLALNGLLIVVIEMVLINKLEGKRNPLTYICTGIILSGLSFVLLNILPHSGLVAILIVVLITLGEIVAMPFMNAFWISRTNNRNRGEYAALYGMSWSAAQVIAPAFGNRIVAYGGFDTLWWVLGSICFLVSIGYYIMKKLTHSPKQELTIEDAF
ncbi:MDR family MFS transporter [Mucilaginibacter flavus]|uniref:MDR family MFS transporter n=1 Tax=Mucilaginibacter flavus TaxID=931504 RepID=UPI0025B37DF2|nr:MFS transporter [Mucilaginibacter flavus]MDN3584868.1 MFS transporter [Mucilaginibacter flavus]